jgi:hypothetical protein
MRAGLGRWWRASLVGCWWLVLACRPAPTVPEDSPKNFRLVSLQHAESTSPQAFSAADWAAGLSLPEAPVTLQLTQGNVSVRGAVAKVVITGEARGEAVSFSYASEEDGTRLDLRFSGALDAARGEIRGSLEQVWELTEEAGNVRLSAEALFQATP